MKHLQQLTSDKEAFTKGVILKREKQANSQKTVDKGGGSTIAQKKMIDSEPSLNVGNGTFALKNGVFNCLAAKGMLNDILILDSWDLLYTHKTEGSCAPIFDIFFKYVRQ